MDITRDNYEEYFLLYADDELTDSEKVAVILFLKNNKDLEEEFKMIHHTISKPDNNIQLTDKSFLFKKNYSFINEKNYEEVFVLYHDNELSGNERLQTEEFLLHHKQLKDEFELISLARFTPESSEIFKDKKILYKKEKSGKVVPLIFWRMLAAAVFIGFGLWITNLYLKKPDQLNKVIAHIAPVNTSSEKNKKDIFPGNKKVEEKAIQTPEVTSPDVAITIHDKKDHVQKSLLKNANNDAVVKNIITTQKPVKENIDNPLPDKIRKENVIDEQQIKNIAANEISSANTIESKQELVQIENTVNTQPENYAKTASYVVVPDNKNENYVFYDITADKFKKTKVGGFFKKVKRVIERNNPVARLLSGDERQVVAK